MLKYPSPIDVFPMRFYLGEHENTIKEVMSRILHGGLLRKTKFAIIINSEKLIMDLSREFVSTSASNREHIRGINDNILRRALLSGQFGYILDHRNAEIQNDNKIVADYFNMGELKLLLATFSIIHWPVNGIQEMYLPRIPNDQYGKPDLFGLAQIVGKVGDEQGGSCTIYTDGKNIDIVAQALNLSPEEYEDLRILNNKDGFMKTIFKGLLNK